MTGVVRERNGALHKGVAYRLARGRSFAPNRALAPLVSATFRALASDPISVRISFGETASYD